MAGKRKAGEQSLDYDLVRQVEALQDRVVVMTHEKKEMQDELSRVKRAKASLASQVDAKQEAIFQLQEQVRACQEDLTRPDKELLTLIAGGGVVLKVDKVTAQAASEYFRKERFGTDKADVYDFTEYNQRAVGLVILLMVQKKNTHFEFPEDLGENEIVVGDMVRMIDYIQLFEEQQQQARGEYRYTIKKVLNAALAANKMGVLLEVNNVCTWLRRECQDDHEVQWVESMYSHVGTAISGKISSRQLICGADASDLIKMDSPTISMIATLLAPSLADVAGTYILQSATRGYIPSPRYIPTSPRWSPPLL